MKEQGLKEIWPIITRLIRTAFHMVEHFSPTVIRQRSRNCSMKPAILEDQTIQVTATVVRIPVVGGHSEAVNIEFEKDFKIEDVIQLLNDFPGVVVYDNPAENKYPMPILAHNRDEVFVGRIRRDLSKENCLNLWIVSDNIRKGAATNAVQIAEYMAANKLY